MREGKLIQLRHIARSLELALASLDDQDQDIAAAHLDLCLHELRRSIGSLEAGSPERARA